MPFGNNLLTAIPTCCAPARRNNQGAKTAMRVECGPSPNARTMARIARPFRRLVEN